MFYGIVTNVGDEKKPWENDEISEDEEDFKIVIKL